MKTQEEVYFSELIGKKVISVEIVDDCIYFYTNYGNYVIIPDDNYGTYVSIDDICGELYDLIGETIIDAIEVCNHDNPLYGDESFTWTFYHISTLKTHITIRFYGTSNGYYSEDARLYKIIE